MSVENRREGVIDKSDQWCAKLLNTGHSDFSDLAKCHKGVLKHNTDMSTE